MSGQPEISVCVPVYNAAPYLQQCIDSLMDQTVSVETEYIFVNDGSTDASGEILRQNQAAYPDKIRILEHPENLGNGSARNTLLRAARGRYIGFVDSDDFVAPRMFETLYRNAIETGADVTHIQYALVDKETRYDRERGEIKGHVSSGVAALWRRLLAWHNRELTDEGRMDLLCYGGMSVHKKLWKKSVFDENNLSFPERLRYEDSYVALAVCYLTKVAFVPEVLYFYRRNPNSTIHAQNAPHQFDRVKVKTSLMQEVKRRNLFERYYPAWEYLCVVLYAFNTCKIFLRTFTSPQLDIIGKLCSDLRENFPEWRQNRYYQAITTEKDREWHELLCRFSENPTERDKEALNKLSEEWKTLASQPLQKKQDSFRIAP